MTLQDILTSAVKKHASDVHLKAGLTPIIRKHGKLRPLQQGLAPLSGAQVEEMAMEVLDDEQRRYFASHKEVDVGYGLSGIGRFRINIFRQRGAIRMVVRNIPYNVPTLEELGMPGILKTIAGYERGLILVTGVTGSGKSSTLAAMIDYINNNQNAHILTIEDPIEFLIRDRKSIISQRELGLDTMSFASALKSALRQDPDVILIGEMRDPETFQIAMTAAETGHLVLSTMHTLDSKECINRILGAFPPHEQAQVRRQIAAVLKAVVSQRLAKRKDGSGFVPAVEILVNNQRVKEMIEDPERTGDLHIAIEESKDTVGMQSFDQSLMDLLAGGLIDYEEAIKLSTNPEDFQLRASGVGSGEQNWHQNSGLHEQARGTKWNDVTNLEIDRDSVLTKKSHLTKSGANGDG